MKFIFLTDAPPLREMASGCHGLATHLIDAADDQILWIATHRSKRQIRPKLLKSLWGRRLFLIQDCSGTGARRFFPELSRVLDIFLALPSILFMRRKLKAGNPDRIFVLMGGNGWFIPIVSIFSKLTNLPYDVYLVDDLEDSAQLWKRKILARIIRGMEARFLNRANKVYAISQGYSDLLNAKYGVQSIWLPPPMSLPEFSYTPKVELDEPREITFVGGLSSLYQSALVDLYSAIQNFNRQASTPKLRLRIITYGDVGQFTRQLPDLDALVVSQRIPAKELEAHLRSAWAVFLPYSFDPSMEKMVSTSFSWKLQDYFKCGRPILAYGPPYATVPRYFKEEGLPLVANTFAELEECIRQIESFDNLSTIESYRKTWDRLHSPKAFQHFIST